MRPKLDPHSTILPAADAPRFLDLPPKDAPTPKRLLHHRRHRVAHISRDNPDAITSAPRHVDSVFLPQKPVLPSLHLNGNVIQASAGCGNIQLRGMVVQHLNRVSSRWALAKRIEPVSAVPYLSLSYVPETLRLISGFVP